WLIGEIDLTEQVLLKSAIPTLSHLCTGGVANVSPNPASGYGRLDGAAAVELALQRWEVRVAVMNGGPAPRAGAEVFWIDARTGYSYTASSDVSGTATISPTLAGVYTLQVRGAAGTVEIENLALVNEGTDSNPRTMRFEVLYDEAVVPFESRHFL